MLGVGLACGGGDGPIDPPDPGTLAVTTATGGSFLDSNGYTFAVSGGAEQPIGVSDTESLSVAATSHTVVIGNIAPQCNVTNGFLTQTVNVQENQTTTVVFDLECGLELDSETRQELCVQNADNGGEALDITEGTAVIGAISGLLDSGDCVEKTEGGLPSWFFERWHVATSTPGTYEFIATPDAGLDVVLRVFEVLDSQGNTQLAGSSDQGGMGVVESIVLLLQGLGGGSASVSSGDGVLLSASSEFGYFIEAATFEHVDFGSYGLKANLTTEDTTESSGIIEVTTITTGDRPDPDGYFVTLIGKPPRHVGTNYTTTFPVPKGTYAVGLSGLAPNCSVGDPSQDVSVAAGDTERISYSVDCPGDPPVTWPLTVTGSGTGNGTVTGLGINCTITAGSTSGDCSEIYDDGTSVNLTATGSDFTGWSGACTGTGTCTVVMSQDRTVTAYFEIPENQPPVPEITAPAPNSVFADGETITFAGSATDPEDGQLTGSSLVWLSDIYGSFGTGTTVSTSALPPGLHLISLEATDSGGLNVSANIFITITSIGTVTILTEGDGTGTVTSNPAGISCQLGYGMPNVGTCSAAFTSGTQVTLTAVPSGDSYFNGWANWCGPGTLPCVFTIVADNTYQPTVLFMQKVNGMPTMSSAAYSIRTPYNVCGIADMSTIDYTFQFTDAEGDIDDTTVTVDFVLDGENGEPTTYTSDPQFNAIISGNGFSGTLLASNCIFFGDDAWIDATSRVRDAAGNLSNPVTQRVYHEPGAN